MPVSKVELESALCDLCGGEHTRLLYRMPDLRFRNFEPEYSVVECKACGHRFLSPRPTVESALLLYPESYYSGRGISDPRQERRFLLQKNYLSGLKKGRLLEVGCAGGEWLKLMKGEGWECYGADLLVSPYQEEGLDIRCGYLPDLRYPEASFSVVCAWGALEHVREPSCYFRCIQTLLKPEGSFIFLVPNGDSLWSRWAYKEDIPRHLHFFRPSILRAYAKQYGFVFRGIDYTNQLYSRPATGRGMFRRRLLRMAGADWDEILESPRGIARKGLAKLGGILDRCLIHPGLEELLGLCGNMVVTFERL